MSSNTLARPYLNGELLSRYQISPGRTGVLLKRLAAAVVSEAAGAGCALAQAAPAAAAALGIYGENAVTLSHGPLK